jgi:ATP-dependent Clp protease protease subunit
MLALVAAMVFGYRNRSMNKDETRMPYSDKLLKERAILLGFPIDDQTAREVIARLLFLEKMASNAPVTLYINSPGGSVTAGLAIIETIESLKPEVRTCCIGQAHSIAAIILAAGSAGRRSAVTNALIAFSEIRAGGELTPEKQAHLERMKAALLDKTTNHTKMSLQQVSDLFASSRPLTPSEARSLGIIDFVSK